MNSFELGGIVGLLGGVAAGAVVGHAWHSGPGLLAGGLLGGLIGAFLGSGSISAAYALAIAHERSVRRNALREHFGEFWKRTDAWAALKETLAGGATLGGRVVWLAPYAAFLEVSSGFPAMLKAVDGGVLGPLPAVGSANEAQVLEFDDDDCIIELTLRERVWVSYEGVRVAYLAGNPPVHEGRAFTFAITNSTQRRFAERLAAGERLAAQLSDRSNRVIVSQPDHRGTGALLISEPELRPADSEVERARGDPPGE